MFTQETLNACLLRLGPTLLKPEYRETWSRDNPTYGYCYIVSEVIYHYILAQNANAFCISFGGGTHWFVVADGIRYDLTAEQFRLREIEIPYEKAVAKGFFKGSVKTPRGYISKRAHKLYEVWKSEGVYAFETSL